MILTRRTFLATTAASAFLPRVALATPITLRAEPVSAQILPETEPATRMLGLNGSTPGPELRLRQGETLSVLFDNQTDQGSAMHWHGIRIDNAMDGVPGLTQDLVEPGTTFDYNFVTPDPGTYWYHSHARSWEQVERGLYGPLIVEETNPPPVDHDITVIVDDWRMDRSGQLAGDFGNRHDFSHGGRLGNFARAVISRPSVRQGDRIRLRLINTATARIFPLEVTGIEGVIVALDGMPLPDPMPISDLVMAPAQRIDIIADVADPVSILIQTGEGPYELGQIALEGMNADPIINEIVGLPMTPTAMPAPTPDHALTLTMEGGAMGGRHSGEDLWGFNGQSNLTDTPFARFDRGQTARITLVNETAFPHGIHLHGHHFHEVAADGSLGPQRDTTLVNARETRDIVCVFDNPGQWLLHCHMLGHQAAGMKTWVQVA
ncbi:multicopper oxidase family protein [Gymnodinialimonas sp. 57CJ19]|uniref:multicopper oxidase family protein n=1 Tax=Gymnodinialimonas sp. 57CJ19 TaxID=3138498 RepID=UPI0031343998